MSAKRAAENDRQQPAKKTKAAAEAREDEPTRNDSDDSDSGEESKEQEIIDVDFDYFDPQPGDFHAIKRLLSNLFEKDVVNLTELTDFLLGQTTFGTCVKVDGSSDPYSFLSVLNLQANKNSTFVKQIKDYLLSKTKGESRAKFQKYLEDPSNHVGMVFNERLINMPVQTAPPMFQMLLEEIQWKLEEGAPYKFKYLLFFIKTYRELANTDETDDSAASSSKPQPKTEKGQLFYFNEEEEFIQQESVFEIDFKLPKDQAAARWTFADIGIQPARKVVLVEFAKMNAIVEKMKSEIRTDALKRS